MSLTIFDKNLNQLTSSIPTFHNGFTGEAYEELFYIRNVHDTFYYEDITLKVNMSDLQEGEIFSESGWSIKLSNTSEQPTEKQWGDILVNSTISIPSIGSSEVANTESIIPVWIRVFCPGNTLSQIKQDMSLTLKYSKRVVGDGQ